MTEAKKEGVVWILGAGFSRPLGGPLLHDLISEGTLGEVSTVTTSQAPEHRFVVDVYNCGKRSNEQPDGLWNDPEQALEMLEIAKRDESCNIAKRITEHLGRRLSNKHANGRQDVKAIHQKTQRFVALACECFLRGVTDEDVLNTERWSPFLRWAKQLRHCDTVVTFNYDRVPNLLSDREEGASFVSPVEPNYDDLVQDGADLRYVPLLNMHGSVLFTKTAEGKLELSEEFEVPVIATPGPPKLEFSKGQFKDIWSLALDSIRRAHAIVFVGYRFPETDNYAKQRLLDAIRENSRAKVHIVLGTESDSDVRRLTGMLEWSGVPYVRRRVHHMWCQDFFAVFNREEVLDPPKLPHRVGTGWA